MALFDTMCDVRSVSEKLNEDINVQGRDELELLYNWLESLLLKFELEQKVYSRFKVTLATASQTLRINARAYGESFDRQRHHPKVEVKAATYHRMEVRQEGSVTTLRFILDL